MNDVLAKVAADGQRAVSLFLPSIATPPQPPPQPPNPMAFENPMMDGIRALKLAGKVEGMAYRTARGLPPIKPPTPESEFGNILDVAHTRALSRAIANHPEEEQGRLISEAHDQATKWIAAQNGKVIVHGKVEIASGPEAAEKLAQRIVNDTVNEHDERESGSAAGNDNKPDASSGSGKTEHDSPGKRTPAPRPAPVRPPAPNPRVAAAPSLPRPQPADNGSPAGPGTLLGAPPVVETPSPQVPPDAAPQAGPEETPQGEASAIDSGDDNAPSISVVPDSSATPSATVGNDGLRDVGSSDDSSYLSGPDRGSNPPLVSEPDSRPADRKRNGGKGSGVLAKGTSVTLRDGRAAEVQWHHPGAGLLRVKIDGKSAMVQPGDLAS